MNGTLVAFAAGVGIVYAAAKVGAYVRTPQDEGGRYPYGPHVATYGGPLAGGLLLVLVHHLTKGEA